jgi:CubicO group peptidase (beta-lactamase class C family)
MNRKTSFLLTFISCFVFIISCSSLSQDCKRQIQDVFPGESWIKIAKPEDLGYSSKKLAKAREYSESIHTAAVVIVAGGQILDEWGDIEEKYMTHSVRKSFLSALYGNYVHKGVIDLNLTMDEMEIDDVPPLTDEEKQATLRDCLKATSGIYHTALYESAGMKALKPPRHSKKAGEFWYYNNWDFNAAGTIFEKYSGKKIFDALEQEIAEPIQMESFVASDGWYVTGEESIHPAYPFRITARDMARFGLLMLHKGNWNGKQVIPAEWVEESTRYYSDAALYSSDGYGYMWWVVKKGNEYPHLPGVDIPEGSFSARGAGGHYIIVIPEYDLIIVHRVNTDERGNGVSGNEMGKLVNLILSSCNN